jgi:hypothetical protein
MEYRILGSLELRDGDRSIPLGSPQQRTVLAALLLGDRLRRRLTDRRARRNASVRMAEGAWRSGPRSSSSLFVTNE